MKLVLLGLSLMLPSALPHAIQQDGIGIFKRINDLTTSDEVANEQPPIPEDSASTPVRIPGQPCTNYWAGTAPFCDPDDCPSGWHEEARDKRGDGKKCWSGSKRLCVCDVGRGPVFCDTFWAGTAPICRGECPSGYKVVDEDDEGDGGFCFSGTKKKCQCINGTPRDRCKQGPPKTKCLGFALFCNNGCSKFFCGGCFGFTFGNTDNSAENRDNSFYQTLLTEQNAPLRQALLDTGAPLPPDASNDIVAETAVRYLDTVADFMATVDTAASFPQWEDSTTWKGTNGQPVIVPQPADIEVPTPETPPESPPPQPPSHHLPDPAPPLNNPNDRTEPGRPPLMDPNDNPGGRRPETELQSV